MTATKSLKSSTSTAKSVNILFNYEENYNDRKLFRFDSINYYVIQALSQKLRRATGLVRSESIVTKRSYPCDTPMGVRQNPWTPTKRRGPIAAETASPGPAVVSLPSLIGKYPNCLYSVLYRVYYVNTK